MDEVTATKVPTNIVDLTFDYFGIEVKVLRFNLDLLEGGTDVYLATDKCGDLSIYQYKPVCDPVHGDFDPGRAPENALDCGYYDIVTELDMEELGLQTGWADSIAKYKVNYENK